MDPVLAAVSPDAIIYLVVLVIWGLAQLTRLSKKKGAEARPSRPEPAAPVPPELRELLETLTGRTVITAPQPAPTRRIPNATPPKSAAPQRNLAPPPTPAPMEPQPVAIKTANEYQPVAEPPRADLAGVAHLIRQTVPAIPVMHLPVMTLASMATGHLHPSPLLRGLRNHDELRAAFAQRAVLGPPRAFDPP